MSGCENSLMVGGLELVHIFHITDRILFYIPHTLPCIFTNSKNKDTHTHLCMYIICVKVMGDSLKNFIFVLNVSVFY